MRRWKHGSALRARNRGSVVKRGFDFVIASLALILLAPAFLAIGLFIKCDSAGSVFYRDERVGRHGTRFRAYKFRTTVTGTDRGDPGSRGPDNPRITPFGWRLRRSRLD